MHVDVSLVLTAVGLFHGFGAYRAMILGDVEFIFTRDSIML